MNRRDDLATRRAALRERAADERAAIAADLAVLRERWRALRRVTDLASGAWSLWRRWRRRRTAPPPPPSSGEASSTETVSR